MAKSSSSKSFSNYTLLFVLTCGIIFVIGYVVSLHLLRSKIVDQVDNVAPVMERLASRKLYPGDRLICPGIMPAERRIEDAGKPWVNTIATESYEGSHIVLTVHPNCKDYTITFISAEDEDMNIKSVIPFTV